MLNKDRKTFGIVAEFDGPQELLSAAEKVRDAGFKVFDCHSPFPVHGMDQAMGLKRSPLGYIVGFMAFCGLALGIHMQWYSNVIVYPFIISGKPVFSFQAYAPVGFGVAVLLGAFAAFFGMLALNKLPRFFHPVFYSDNFTKFSDDGFFISIDSNDQNFDNEKTAEFFMVIGGKNIEVLKEKI
ncbi:DUF3341 domain-containing protein [candidate division KSB1 bacterium]